VIFESRELREYAEPVSSTDLVEGTIYFAVNFVDGKGLVPVMEPVVFVGRDLGSGEQGQVYFQDADSYNRGVRYSSAAAGREEKGIFDVCSAHSLNHIFDFEGALNVLLGCSLRRKKAGV
jgi:hypothetical protein